MGLDILLVDDSVVSRALVSRALQPGGLDGASTKESEEGHEGQDGRGAQGDGGDERGPIGWNLPDRGALRFVAEVRESSAAPAVVHAPASGEDTVDDPLEVGADDSVSEPFTPGTLEKRST